MSGLLDDRSCVICRETFDAGDEGRRVVHCCRVCGHPTDAHSNTHLRCSVCGNECAIDCRPPWLRASDPWPVRLAGLAA